MRLGKACRRYSRLAQAIQQSGAVFEQWQAVCALSKHFAQKPMNVSIACSHTFNPSSAKAPYRDGQQHPCKVARQSHKRATAKVTTQPVYRLGGITYVAHASQYLACHVSLFRSVSRLPEVSFGGAKTTDCSHACKSALRVGTRAER